MFIPFLRPFPSPSDRSGVGQRGYFMYSPVLATARYTVGTPLSVVEWTLIHIRDYRPTPPLFFFWDEIWGDFSPLSPISLVPSAKWLCNLCGEGGCPISHHSWACKLGSGWWCLVWVSYWYPFRIDNIPCCSLSVSGWWLKYSSCLVTFWLYLC